MIQSKKINIIAAIAVVIALIISIAFVIFGNIQAESGGMRTETEYATKIFGSDIISIEIIADEADWQEMLDNAISEQYIMADVVVNGTKFQNVGVRPKGNSSLTQVASSNSDRYSFRLQFDEYIKGQTCFGLDSFVVNNMLGDNTYMKEYVSYELMQEIGVDAPFFGFADIKVNGEGWGLYLAVENYGDSYEARTFATTSGMMYNVKSMDMGGNNKGSNGFPQGGMEPPANWQNGDFPQSDMQPPVDWQGGDFPQSDMQPPADWQNGDFPQSDMQPPADWQGGAFPQSDMQPPINGQGEETQPNKPTDSTSNATNLPDQQKNDSQMKGSNNIFGGFMGGRGGNGGSLEYSTDDVSSYSAIFDNVVGKGDDSDFKRVINALKVLSTGENLEAYFDVDQILRYLAAHTIVVNLDSYSSSMAQNYYLYENNGKVTILPWDYNLAWGGFQNGNASSVINFPIDSPVSGVEMSSRPLIEKLFSNTEYLEKYHGYLQELMTNYFADGKWEEKITQLDTLITDYVKNDNTALCTFEEYKSAIEAFKLLGNLRYQSIQGQLDGTIPSTTAGQTANPDQLISAGDLNLSSLGSMMGGGNRGDKGERPTNWNNPLGGEGFDPSQIENMPDRELMGNGFMQRPGDNMQNPAENNTIITPDRGGASSPFGVKTNSGTSPTENLILFFGLLALLSLLTFCVAKKRRNY